MNIIIVNMSYFKNILLFECQPPPLKNSCIRPWYMFMYLSIMYVTLSYNNVYIYIYKCTYIYRYYIGIYRYIYITALHTFITLHYL